MSVTIQLDDALVAGLQNKAKNQHMSVEQLAISILTEAINESESIRPLEVVTRIQATGANPSRVRLPTANLGDLLRDFPVDFSFDQENWQRQWSVFEAGLKSSARANDVAEGCGR